MVLHKNVSLAEFMSWDIYGRAKYLDWLIGLPFATKQEVERRWQAEWDSYQARAAVDAAEGGKGEGVMVRVLITGCRHWRPERLVSHLLCRLMERYGSVVVVHGAATGVDATFHEHASDMGHNTEPHPADWKTHGRGAGPKRNAEMVAAGADLCLALHRNIRRSRGTKDCARRAIQAGIPTYILADEMIPAPLSQATLCDLD